VKKEFFLDFGYPKVFSLSRLSDFEDLPAGQMYQALELE